MLGGGASAGGASARPAGTFPAFTTIGAGSGLADSGSVGLPGAAADGLLDDFAGFEAGVVATSLESDSTSFLEGVTAGVSIAAELGATFVGAVVVTGAGAG